MINFPYDQADISTRVTYQAPPDMSYTSRFHNSIPNYHMEEQNYQNYRNSNKIFPLNPSINTLNPNVTIERTNFRIDGQSRDLRLVSVERSGRLMCCEMSNPIILYNYSVSHLNDGLESFTEDRFKFIPICWIEDFLLRFYGLMIASEWTCCTSRTVHNPWLRFIMRIVIICLSFIPGFNIFWTIYHFLILFILGKGTYYYVKNYQKHHLMRFCVKDDSFCNKIGKISELVIFTFNTVVTNLVFQANNTKVQTNMNFSLEARLKEISLSLMSNKTGEFEIKVTVYNTEFENYFKNYIYYFLLQLASVILILVITIHF